MLALDASSIIYAWDNYPKDQFPSLWRWLEQQIKCQQIAMSSVAFEEVEVVSPECAGFLGDTDIHRYPVDGKILYEAMQMKQFLGIVNDNYGAGVDENDLLIIGTAKVHGLVLVSDESPQLIQPKENRNLKMPRVSRLPQVDVECISFLEMIRKSGEVFG